MTAFPIADADSRFLWFLVPLALVLLTVVAVVAVTVSGPRVARFEVLPDALRIRGDLYGRSIPFAELRVDEARRVDFVREPDLLPTRRTMGTGLPGYQAGWFKLRTVEKSLLYLSDRSKAVYIPTSAGYSVLISPADPDEFIRTLQDRAP